MKTLVLVSLACSLLSLAQAISLAQSSTKEDFRAKASSKSVPPTQVFPDCSDLDPAIVEEIQLHQSSVDAIIDYVLNGDEQGRTYNSLGSFVEGFGPRLSGTAVLEEAIDFVVSTATEEGFDEVYTEDVLVPHWLRNYESAVMVEPREQKLNMLGLGNSVATPPEGLTAEIIAVTSFDELALVADQVPGKIVVYNQPFESYGQSVEYRGRGAAEAAKVGAVAALVRSATDFSIGSPHTGGQNYEDGVPEIPVACITQEDAQMIHRLYQGGKTISVNLTMNAVNMPEAVSRNTIIDLKGYEQPEDFVVVSGHIDSWDVGVGAMDDAGGCFISYHANLVLKQLGLRARRTVRTIMFTAEEAGLYGGYDYFTRHQNQSANYQMLMESDFGTFSPKGIAFTGSDTATCIMQEIVKLTAAMNTTELETSAEGPDIGMWMPLGVPIGSLVSESDRYFWFHHSSGDTMEVEDPDALDRITALWASVAFVAADLSVNFQDI